MSNPYIDILNDLKSAPSLAERSQMLLQMTLGDLSPMLQEALKAAAVPHWYDVSFLGTLLGISVGESELLIDELAKLSFIEVYPDKGYNVHDRTRNLIRDYLRSEYPEQLQSWSQASANHCKKQDFQDRDWEAELAYHSQNLDEPDGRHTIKDQIPWQLPTRVEQFTGREKEIEWLVSGLLPDRILALIGPGGTGKTTLGSEAVYQLDEAGELSNRFPDGVVFHSFYSQPQVNLALEHIARSYGEDPKAPEYSASRVLESRMALIFLDGCEDADDLSKILGVRGKNTVLITSRKRSDAQNLLLEIKPLAQREAVSLLQKISGNTLVEEKPLRQIAKIVEGLPLAVHLAGSYLANSGESAKNYAAWLQQKPLGALTEDERRMDSVVYLIERSLKGLNDTTYNILSVAGQLSLAPFRYEVVAAIVDSDDSKLRHGFDDLIRRGLLLRHKGRFQVGHALIRTYAKERMKTKNFAEALGHFYIALNNEQRELGLAGYERLRAELPHVMHLLSTLQVNGKWHVVNQLVWSIQSFLDIQGHISERITCLESGIKATKELNLLSDQAKHLGNLGVSLTYRGRVHEAIKVYFQALAIDQKINDKYGESNHLGNLGAAYRTLGQVEKAISYYEQALAISRKISHRQGEGVDLGNLGNAYRALGQVEKAISFFKQALAILREIGDRRGEGAHLGNLANAYRDLGQVEKAITYYEQALAIAREIGHRQNEGNWLGNLGAAYSALGHMEQAITYYEQALAIAREIGHRQNEGNWLGNLGAAYRTLGQVEQAISYYEQALVIAREIGDRQGESTELGNLGAAYRTLGQMEQAISYYEQALVIAREIGDRQGEGNRLGNLGNAYSDLGQVEQAITYYEQSLAISQEIGHRQNEGVWLGNLGNAYSAIGEVEQAITYYMAALEISRRFNDRQGEHKRLGNLGNAYSAIGEVEQAISYYEQALVIAREIGDRQGEHNRLGNLGNAYRALGQVEKAISYYKQALNISRKLGDRQGEGTDLGNLGNAYRALGQVEQAISYYKKALEISRRFGDRQGEGSGLGNLGNAYRALGQVKKARQYLSQSVAIFEEIKSPNADLVRRWLNHLPDI